MDYGAGQRVSALTGKNVKEDDGMKFKIKTTLLALVIMLLAVPLPVQGAGNDGGSKDPGDLVGQVKEQLKEVFSDIDQETAEEVFSFLKDKSKDGNLSSQEGILDAIEEGKEKFGVEISEKDAEELVDTMEKLEGLGFSAEYVIDKTENLYQQYGEDFVEHVDEVVTGAVKNAASNVVNQFFDNLKSSVKSFFGGLFS